MERGERPQGRFWVLQDLDADDLDADEPGPAVEEGEDSEDFEPPSAPSATLGDAFLCARDLRGIPKRKGRCDRFRALEERLRRCRTSTLSASSPPFLPPFRYRQISPTPRRASPLSSLSSDEEQIGSDWFRIVGGKAVRIGPSPDSTPTISRRVGRKGSWASDGSPAALFPSRSPVRSRRESGDDVYLTAGIFVSIRTLGRYGPPAKPSTGNSRAGNTTVMADLAGSSSPLRETSLAVPHLDSIFQHLWISPARVSGEAPAAEPSKAVGSMGDRFGNQGGGNWRGGGYGFQPYNNYNHQRPPPPSRPENPQYKRKDQMAPSNSSSQGGSQQGAPTNQPRAPPVNLSGASTGGVAAAASSSAAGSVSAINPDLSKVLCMKCREKGHAVKNCPNKVECINCGKPSHLSENCTWLKQKKPVASFIGFGAPGLGCFVADHVKDAVAEDKGSAVALVKIVEVVSSNVSADRLKLGLGKTYPWKWDWKVNKLADGMFLVDFPSLARISEAAIYDCVPLRGTNLMINVSQWDDGMQAAGKLSTVWVQARGIPSPLLHYQGICQAGSTIGHVIEVDMKSLKNLKIVRIKVGVVDHRLIPVTTRVTTPDLFYYNVRFKLEEVVEEGWVEDEALLKTLVDMDDKRLDEIEARESKRIRTDGGNSSGTKNHEGSKTIQASESTKQALLQRELVQKQQNAIDVNLLKNKTPVKSGFNVSSKKAETVEAIVEDGSNDEDERVQLTGNDGDYEGYENYADSQESLGTRLGIKLPGDDQVEDADATDEETLRCSGRLQAKNNDDIPVMDRAKNLAAARNLDPSEGEGGRKAGTAAGRKFAGKGR